MQLNCNCTYSSAPLLYYCYTTVLHMHCICSMNRDVHLPSRLSHVANVELAEIMKLMFCYTSRRWEGICESNPTTAPFEYWVLRNFRDRGSRCKQP
jgi:hypothetical protein